MADMVEADSRLARNRSPVSTLSDESKVDISPASLQGESTEGDAFIAKEPINRLVGSGSQQKCEKKSRSNSTAEKNDSFEMFQRHTLSLWLASTLAIASIFVWTTACI